MPRRRTVLLLILLSVVGLGILSFLTLVMLRGSLYDDEHAARCLRVACVTMTCDVDPTVNRARMLDMVRVIKRAHPDVELILFGEAVTGWYSVGAETKEYRRRIAESVPGETTAMMSTAAQELRTYLCFGLTELSGERTYNSQVLIDPAGVITAVHRKVNLQGATTFAPGSVPVTMADIKGVRTAIIICSDIQSSAVRKELGAQTPDLILGSLANPSDPNWFISGLIAKLFDAWILTANRYGPDGAQFFDGQMIIADPLGQLRVKAKDQAQYIYYVIGFDGGRSPARRFLGRLYVWESLGLHMIKNIGTMLSLTRS